MAALVEVHDRRELDTAVAAGSRNHRRQQSRSATFEVTLDTSLRLAEHMPAGVVRVSESGIHDAARYGAPARRRLHGVSGGRAPDEIGRSGGGARGELVAA